MPKQRRPLHVAFIDLTKAFDIVSWKDLFTLLRMIGCSPKLLRMITSFHEDMQGTIQYYGSPFPIQERSEVGLRPWPKHSSAFSSPYSRSYAFNKSEDGIHLHIRSDGNLVNLSRQRARTKVRRVLIREMLFADDAALTAQTEEALQKLIGCLHVHA